MTRTGVRRLALGAGALALVLGGCSSTPSDPTASSATGLQTILVYLCTSSSVAEQCSNHKANGAETEAVRVQLTATDGVTSVEYESEQLAYERFQQEFSDSPLSDTTQPGDLPASFTVVTGDPASAAAARSGVESMPGVDRVVVVGPDPG